MRGRKRKKLWPRERILDALRRFWRLYGEAPTSTWAYEVKARAAGRRAFPMRASILGVFSSLRAAWLATGIEGLTRPCRCGGGQLVLNSRQHYCRECISKRQSRAQRRSAPGRTKYQPTPEIDAQIRRTYNEEKRSPCFGRVRALAERLGWPRWAVQKRARALGLIGMRRKEPNWSPQEIALLERYAYMVPDRIAVRLREHGYSRTATGITLQLKRRDLRRRRPYYSGHQFACCIGEDGHLVAKWAEAGLLPFLLKGTTRKRPQGGDVRMFHETDVYLFMDAHRELWDARKCDQEWLKAVLFDFPREHAEELAARRAEWEAAGRLPTRAWDGAIWHPTNSTGRARRRPVGGRKVENEEAEDDLCSQPGRAPLPPDDRRAATGAVW